MLSVCQTSVYPPCTLSLAKLRLENKRYTNYIFWPPIKRKIPPHTDGILKKSSPHATTYQVHAKLRGSDVTSKVKETLAKQKPKDKWKLNSTVNSSTATTMVQRKVLFVE